MKNLNILLVIILCSISCLLFASGKVNENEKQLKCDLEKVWPLVQTVKIEFELAVAQMEFLQTKEEKDAFMEEYESFVKEKYFKNVIELNIRQGKLLLLLIHRELGKTPYELLREYRSIWRANFWQRFAKLVGANLKEEYNATLYPNIESEVVKLCIQLGKGK